MPSISKADAGHQERGAANGNSAAMKGVMHLVSDEEIKVLADYLSKLKP
jgi:cytochrome c553